MEQRHQDTIRAMVAEIGSEPLQDAHFDAWYYPGQTPAVFGLQKYEQAVIRQYLRMIGGDTPPAGVVGAMNALMAVCMAPQ